MKKAKNNVLSIQPKARKRNAPSTAFKVGGPNPNAFRPGVCPNPGGRPKDELRLVNKALRAQLNTRAPNEIAQLVGLDPGASWAQCVASSLLYMAVKGDVGAAREIRECTEGNRSRLELVDEQGAALRPPSINITFLGTSLPAAQGYRQPALEG
jgi:hypothetical protein